MLLKIISGKRAKGRNVTEKNFVVKNVMQAESHDDKISRDKMTEQKNKINNYLVGI